MELGIGTHRHRIIRIRRRILYDLRRLDVGSSISEFSLAMSIPTLFSVSTMTFLILDT